MREKRDKIVYIVLIIMGLAVVSSLAFSACVGYLYVKEQDAVQQTLQTQQEAVVTVNQGYTEEEVETMLEKKEVQVREEMKKKIQELVESSGGSIYMLRYFFPEKLVFADEGRFLFIPVLDSVEKHPYKSENFKFLDNKECIYEENGEVLSHKGIDVSKYQGKIEWDKVKADGVEFAIIRLGIRGYESGKIVLDEYFDRNMREANEAGVLTGVYFFTQAVNEEEAIEEAQFVIEHLQDYDVTCPVVLDIEKIEGAKGRANGLTSEERTDVAIAFCETIKEAGYTPMIYGNIKCFGKMLDMTRLEEYQKWFAFYDEYLYFPYRVDMWQYTENGSVDGIKGNVDMNIAFHLW